MSNLTDAILYVPGFLSVVQYMEVVSEEAV